MNTSFKSQDMDISQYTSFQKTIIVKSQLWDSPTPAQIHGFYSLSSSELLQWIVFSTDLLSDHLGLVENCMVRFARDWWCLCPRRWSLNGTHINLGLDRRRRLSGGNLIISSLDRQQDVGLYQCMAYNTVGAILSRRASLQFACKLQSEDVTFFFLSKCKCT